MAIRLCAMWWKPLPPSIQAVTFSKPTLEDVFIKLTWPSFLGEYGPCRALTIRNPVLYVVRHLRC
jgi:hypothetical protein